MLKEGKRTKEKEAATCNSSLVQFSLDLPSLLYAARNKSEEEKEGH